MAQIETFTRVTTLAVQECYKCGVAFAMPEGFQKERLRLKNTFYCPAGHGQVYAGKSYEEKLREAQNRASDLAARNRTLANDNMDLAEKNQRQRQRARKRAKAGMCGICKRTFTNYKRHAATQHPTKTGKAK